MELSQRILAPKQDWGENSGFGFPSPRNVICRAQCKMKMWTPC
jgi:hypothetical protein